MSCTYELNSPLIFVGLVIFYGIIVIHDIPYEIAEKRNHPHQDAIHVAGWVSLFTLHALWPFLWIWATLWRNDRGWGMNQHGAEKGVASTDINVLNDKVSALENELKTLQSRLFESDVKQDTPNVEEKN